MTQELNFKIKEYLIIPTHGVGFVKNISKQSYLGSFVLECYEIECKDGLDIMIPKNKIKELGVRSLVSKDFANKQLDLFSKKASKSNKSSWAGRVLLAESMFHSGDLALLRELITTLYTSYNNPNRSYFEMNMFDKALKAVVSELSIVLNRSEVEIHKQIIDNLNKQFKDSTQTKKQSTEDDFSDDEIYIEKEDKSDMNHIYEDEKEDKFSKKKKKIS